MSGFIKAVLALGRGVVPPSINFERPNPAIKFEQTPFYVNRTLTEWKTGTMPGLPRRAGVSSFGMGGTNAHVVLQEAPEPAPSEGSHPSKLLVVSAKSRDALDAATRNLAAHLDAHRGLDLADVAYTLQVGRSVFAHRRAVVCRDVPDAIAALRGQTGRMSTHEHSGESRDVVFLFPGQGAQYAGMARDLYEAEPTFRRQIDLCTEVLRAALGVDLSALLLPAASNPVQCRAASERLLRTEYAQPALFAIDYALARLWIDWGIEPAACIGHSLGEYVAACLAGVFSLEDALKVVAARGRLMQQLPPGAMTSVSLPTSEVEPLLGDRLAIAAANGPRLTVVSGSPAEIERFEQRLAGRVECRRLPIAHAFHSAMMEPILPAFEARVRQTERRPPKIRFVSNVTGTWITDAEATDPTYWARHLRQTVRFSDGTGLPTIPDNDPARSGPRGFAVRFHLGEHVHTDIIAHSANGFPVRTGEEFVEFLRAAAAAGAGKPEALGAFLAAHPSAKRFVELPKPIPTTPRPASRHSRTATARRQSRASPRARARPRARANRPTRRRLQQTKARRRRREPTPERRAHKAPRSR